MAEELEPINQPFTADMTEYLNELKAGADEAKSFAADNKAAADEIKQLAQAVRDNTGAIVALAAAVAEDNKELGDLRDKAAEAGTSLGHLRDEAAEAAVANKALGDSAKDTKDKLDLMGLSGGSTVSKIAPMVGMIGGLVGVAASVAPAFVSAGLGIGAFGAFAIPTAKSVVTAYTGLSQAQQAVANAATSQQMKAAQQQLAAAQKQLQGLSPAARDVVTEMSKVSAEFHTLSQSFASPTLGIMTSALKLLSGLLPVIVPLAQAGATAIQHMMNAMTMGAGSLGFAQFIQTMAANVVPAIDAITRLAGALLGLLGHALEALMPLAAPLINMIAGLVKALSGPLISLLGVFQQLLFAVLKAIEPMLPGLSKFAALLIGDVGRGLQSMIPIISQVIQLLGPALMQILLDLEPVLANLLTPNSGFVAALGLIPVLLRIILPLITGLASILKNPMFATIAADAVTFIVAMKALSTVIGIVRGAMLALNLAFLANPIVLIIAVIALLVIAFVTLWNKSAAFRDFWKAVWHDIQAAVDIAREAIVQAGHDIENAVDAIRETIIKIGHDIEAAWNAAWNAVMTFTNTAGTNLRNAVTSIIGDVVKFFEQLPGRIVSALSNLAGDLLVLGENAIIGLWNGIINIGNQVLNWIANFASNILSTLGNILHIASPSKATYEHGVNLGKGLIQGMDSMLGAVQGAAGRMAGAALASAYAGPSINVGVAAPAGVGGGAAAGGATPAGGSTIVVQVDGQKLFQVLQPQIYQYNVRNSGQVTGIVVPT